MSMLFFKTIHTFLTRSLLVVLLLGGMAGIVSCQSDEEHLEPLPYQVLSTILSTHDITFNEAFEAFKEEMEISEEQIGPYRKKVDMAAMRTRKYKAHVISYHTVDPNGQPVVASGVVYYPQSGTPRGVIEAVAFNKNKLSCPSKQKANMGVLLGMSGYIVLVADLIGCGTTESMLIPYFYHDNAAKVSADFRQAATELVRNVYGRSMPKWNMVCGFSFGASEAWGLARYYHQHPELGVEVSQLWMSGGAYSPLTVLDYQLSTLYSEYAFIPSVLYSLNHYDSLGLDLHEVFRGELSEHFEEWCTGYMPIKNLSQRLGTNIDQYLNLDFFRDGNPEYQKVRSVVETFSIPNDWVPTCSVHVYHGNDDTFVPVSSSDALVAYLRSVGAKVDYVKTETGHLDNGIEMAGDMIEILYK